MKKVKAFSEKEANAQDLLIKEITGIRMTALQAASWLQNAEDRPSTLISKYFDKPEKLAVFLSQQPLGYRLHILDKAPDAESGVLSAIPAMFTDPLDFEEMDIDYSEKLIKMCLRNVEIIKYSSRNENKISANFKVVNSILESPGRESDSLALIRAFSKHMDLSWPLYISESINSVLKKVELTPFDGLLHVNYLFINHSDSLKSDSLNIFLSRLSDEAQTQILKSLFSHSNISNHYIKGQERANKESFIHAFIDKMGIEKTFRVLAESFLLNEMNDDTIFLREFSYDDKALFYGLVFSSDKLNQENIGSYKMGELKSTIMRAIRLLDYSDYDMPPLIEYFKRERYYFNIMENVFTDLDIKNMTLIGSAHLEKELYDYIGIAAINEYNWDQNRSNLAFKATESLQGKSPEEVSRAICFSVNNRIRKIDVICRNLGLDKTYKMMGEDSSYKSTITLRDMFPDVSLDEFIKTIPAAKRHLRRHSFENHLGI